MVIPFLPDYNTWEDWNGNLLHYFDDQQFPYLPETQWRDVANAVAANAAFQKFQVPLPDTFSTWQQWANTFITSVNGAS